MSSAAVAGEASPAGLTRAELAVGGMTCAACAARVEEKLGEIGGVAASVNFATGTARVMAPPEVPLARLIEAAGQAGYQAEPTPRGGGLAGDQGRADAEQVADLRRELAAVGAAEARVLNEDGTERSKAGAGEDAASCQG